MSWPAGCVLRGEMVVRELVVVCFQYRRKTKRPLQLNQQPQYRAVRDDCSSPTMLSSAPLSGKPHSEAIPSNTTKVSAALVYERAVALMSFPTDVSTDSTWGSKPLGTLQKSPNPPYGRFGRHSGPPAARDTRRANPADQRC